MTLEAIEYEKSAFRRYSHSDGVKTRRKDGKTCNVRWERKERQLVAGTNHARLPN